MRTPDSTSGFRRFREARDKRPDVPRVRREPAARPFAPIAAGIAALLRELDGRPYGEYRRIVGSHPAGEFTIIVDHVPADPFAGSARVRLVADRKRAGAPSDLAHGRMRTIGVEDSLARRAAAAIAALFLEGTRPARGAGRIHIEPFGAAMVERSVCRMTAETVELRIFVDLPAAERRIRGLRAEELFATTLPALAASTLLFSARFVADAKRSGDIAVDHSSLQGELARRGLVAFVADGSLLARGSKHVGAPRADGRGRAIEAPDTLAVTIDLPHAGPTRGVGIPAGVTVITGGGLHGKSTLMRALAAGVHPHPAGDGRERVAVIPETVNVRSEPGRAISRLDLSGFLGEVPSGERAADWTTDDASGAVSQAAGVVEALEAGARLLLVDEDSSDAAFLIRDGRMQRFLPAPTNPLVPLIDRVRELYDRFGVSTILATSGAGDYLDAADTVIVLDSYQLRDGTARAREVARATAGVRLHEARPAFSLPAGREPHAPGEPRPGTRVGVSGARGIRVGDETVDLAALDQLCEPGQLRALARLLASAARSMAPGTSLRALVDQIDERIEREGLDALDLPIAYDLARPRRFEIAAALARMRGLRCRRPGR